MSKLEKHVKCEITLSFEKNILCSGLESIFEDKIIEKERDSSVISLNSDNNILFIENEIIFNFENFNYIFDIEDKVKKIIEIQEETDNKYKDINFLKS